MKKMISWRSKTINSVKTTLPVICSFLILTVTWLGVFTDTHSTANAQGLNVQSNSTVIAFDYNDGKNIKQKAKNDFDTVLGSGSSDKVEGKVEQALGNAEQSLGKVTGQAKGVSKQVSGRAKQDIGRTKDAAEDLGSEVKENTESTVDNIRDFFSN
ncbi:MAG: CsbD family protein [Cyanobacteria bacterium P01_A01_bin.84]